MRKKQKIAYLMASLDIENELVCCGEYEVINKRTGNDGIDYYIVFNELGEQKEYPEDFFDMENK